MRTLLASLGVALALLFWLAGTSHAAVFPCSEAGILDAITAGGGPHTFSCAGPTTVPTSGVILIDNDVILDGEGNLTVDAGGSHRVFRVSPLTSVELRALTVTGGQRPDPMVDPNPAAGVLSEGSLTLSGATVSQNTGDGVWAAGPGVLEISDSTIVDNPIGVRALGNSSIVRTELSRNGTGLQNDGTATVVDCDLDDNGTGIVNSGGLTLERGSLLRNGAGVDNNGTMSISRSEVSDSVGFLSAVSNGTAAAVMTITDSHVNRNTSGSVGGGIFNAGQLTLLRSTVDDNTVDVVTPITLPIGGALFNEPAASAEIRDSSLSGNTVNGLVIATGGAAANLGVLVISNSTLSGNAVGATAFAGGAAIQSSGLLAELRLESVTVAANVATAGLVVPDLNSDGSFVTANSVIDGDCGGTLPVSEGGNLESPGNTCLLAGPGDQVSVPAGVLALGPLADNGGATRTRALLAGSSAIDAGLLANCPANDQRGFPRDPACDVGAFEFGAQPPLSCDGAFARTMGRPPRGRSGFTRVEVAGVETPEGVAARITIDAVRQDEPTGRAHGRGRDFCPDAKFLEANLAAVRNERDAQGNGRVYHLSFVASDDTGGGSCEGVATVCVPHDRRGGGGTCIDEGPLFDSMACEERTGGRHHGCGLGFEWVLVLPVWLGLRRRWRASR